MNQNALVETFWKLKRREFSETDFLEEYNKTHHGSSPDDKDIESALVSLYLQKLVQNNVLVYVRGKYIKQQVAIAAEA